MATYAYTKTVNGEIFGAIIQLNETLYPLVSYVHVGPMEGVDGDLHIITNTVLSSSEEDELIAIVNNYDSSPLIQRKYIKDNYATPAMGFGADFIAEFGANNVALGKTEAQIDSLIADNPTLISAALSGSIKSLHRIISDLVADANISQDEIDEFKRRLEVYLGLT